MGYWYIIVNGFNLAIHILLLSLSSLRRFKLLLIKHCLNKCRQKRMNELKAA